MPMLGTAARWVGSALLAVALTISPATLIAQGVGLELGIAAPSAMLQDLDGNPVDILDFVEAGRLTLIEIWASWCENCEALQPQLDQLAARYPDQLSIVAVAVAVAQSQRRVKRHVEEHGASYPYLWDGDGAAVRAYNAATTSIVMILDSEGKVAYSGVGRAQDLVGEVERILGAGARE